MIAVSHPIAHSLPHNSLISTFGSQVNGGCTSISEGSAGDGISICDGTSVLNDGIIPILGEISDNPQSQWADQLFTLNRTASGEANITISFEVGLEHADHDRMELVVFNCPQRGIYTPHVDVFVDTSFRPNGGTFSFSTTSASLQTASCNHLLKFCVKFQGTLSTRFYSIKFPYQIGSHFVFLGEVTFLNALGEPCDPRTPETIIALPTTLRLPLTGTIACNIFKLLINVLFLMQMCTSA